MTIEGTRYDVSVEPTIGRLVDHEDFDLTVNARATVGSSVGAERASNREDTIPNSLHLAQSIVAHTGQQVALHASGVLIAELCPPLER